MSQIHVAEAVADWMRPRVDIKNMPEGIKSTFEAIFNSRSFPFEDAQKAADFTHIPVGYFFSCTPPDEDYEILRTWNDKIVSREAVSLVSHLYCMSYTLSDIARSYSDGLAWTRRQSLNNAPMIIAGLADSEDTDVLYTRIEDDGIIIWQSAYLDHEHTWKIDAGEVTAACIHDTYVPIVYIHPGAKNKARLALWAYNMLLNGYSGIISEKHRPLEPFEDIVSALGLNISGTLSKDEEYYTKHILQILDYGMAHDLIQPTHAGYLMNRNWGWLFDRIDEIKRA